MSSVQPKYRFPFPESVEKRISKPSGRYAHENFPQNAHAIDFLLPLGTPILASRRGYVIVAKHESDKFISDSSEMEKMTLEELIEFSAKNTNAVCIDHGDETFAEYVHLDRQKVVDEGQEVEQGQIIGYCGMSGLTTAPHLHFNSFRIEDGKAISIPIEFSY